MSKVPALLVLALSALAPLAPVLLALGHSPMAAADTSYAPVTPGHPLRFPEDLGSHPQFRTEWWYVTGWLATEGGESLGFQITFFRTKPDIDADNPSDFTPRQIIVAHCALSDPKRGTLWQDQRIRRAALGLGRRHGRRYSSLDRPLVAQAHGADLHRKDRRRGFLIRPRALGNAGRAHQWR